MEKITDAIKEADYSELEGKIITRAHDDEIDLVVVAGFDYHIGMTLKYVKKNEDGSVKRDSEGKVITKGNSSCYNGANSPTPDAGTRLGRYDYDKWFMHAVKALNEGFYSVQESEAASDEKNISLGSGATNCGFSA